MSRRNLAAGVVAGMAAACLGALPVAAASGAVSTKATASSLTGVRELPPGKRYSTDNLGLSSRPQRKAQLAPAAAGTPPVGTVRQWIALDDYNGRLYRKDYTLRGVGDHVEVWVANDLSFPAGDCRAQIPSSTQITDAQVQHLVSEFDTNMYPKETSTFSTPPDRDGTNAQLGPDANGSGGDYTGGGQRTVTLVDNVRDDNYYTFPAAPTYIAGFFSSQFNDLVDRNVMTIDAFDWLHRTTANPPDAPTADLCTSRPARPNLYEGTFAHEWQHLLHSYTDPFETTWLNEGLSDFAQTLTGYVDANTTVFDRGADSHIFCFQGFGPVQTPFNTNPRDCGGPENSLNLWGEDNNPNAVLADYGNAYSFMLYLYDHYGTDIISRLHRDGDLQGLPSTEAALKAEGASSLYRVLHDYQSMVLLDKTIGDARHAVVLGVSADRVTSKSLRSTVNLANPSANDDPGAAPNGADYVALQAAGGKVLRGRDLRSLSFGGAKILPPLPLAWTVVSDDPDRPGNPVLWSGNDSNTDASAVFSSAVPSADPTLRFLAKYGAEAGFDYGYVQVSTDGGATYTTIPGNNTGDAPLGPGLNGTTTGFEAETYDLSAYAGKNVLVAIRYVSDGGVNEGGLKVDDVSLGGTTISDGSSLAPFKSPTEIRPVDVYNWNVRLVGIRDGKVPVIVQAEFDGKNELRLDRRQLGLLTPFDKVVAIVAYDEPTEQVQQYAPYTLTVNGAVQPGGASS
ncbi:MAG: peptidase immune inhibitor [Ilumatobacteraceae bacterium]|nr:peptidase immune inhibitor [Ilumatobacteraceae bacterium]